MWPNVLADKFPPRSQAPGLGTRGKGLGVSVTAKRGISISLYGLRENDVRAEDQMCCCQKILQRLLVEEGAARRIVYQLVTQIKHSLQRYQFVTRKGTFCGWIVLHADLKLEDTFP
jgi:hypothetical protein